jgi:bacterioferritin-associated ferredoxin
MPFPSERKPQEETTRHMHIRLALGNQIETIMMRDYTGGRIIKRMESVMKDIEELANIAAECPTCRRRFKQYVLNLLTAGPTTQ